MVVLTNETQTMLSFLRILKWAKLTYSYIGPVCPVPRLKISHVSTLTSSTNGVKKNLNSPFNLSSLSPQLLSYQATMAETDSQRPKPKFNPLVLRPPWPKTPNLQTHEATTTTKNPETHGATTKPRSYKRRVRSDA